MKAFTTSLAPKNARIIGGFAGGPGCSPKDEADTVFKGVVPGPWLTCYMLRRFGWPNVGSDDYKDLCAWTLTTPMEGLFLHVAPYLGDSMNLSFAVRYTKEVQALLYADPQRDAFMKKKWAAVERWWSKSGSKRYVWGYGRAKGDEDELVHKFSDAREEGFVFGFWKREARHRDPRLWKLPSPKRFVMLEWWLCEFLQKTHPEVKLPKLPKGPRRRTRAQRSIGAALRATMRDLLRPTNIRDLSFTPFGDVERNPDAISRYSGQEKAGYWEGAGYAPPYWYSAAGRKARAETAAKA